MDRVVVCDCHHAPMQNEAVVSLPSGKTILCWMSDCGRYYSRFLGYFHLHGLAETGNYLDSETRSSRACAGETCTWKFMALVYDPGSGGKAMYWYCFKCGQLEWEDTRSTANDKRGAA